MRRWLRVAAITAVVLDFCTPDHGFINAWAQAGNNSSTVAPGDAFPGESLKLPGGAMIADPLIQQQRVTVNPDGSIRAQTIPPPCYGEHFLSAANLNQKVIKTGPGALCGAISLTNSSATTAMYLRLFDSGTLPACTSATGIIWSVQIPVNSTAANVAGIVIPLPTEGITFKNGLAVCLTGAYSDTDNTNAATGVAVNLGVR